MNKESVLNLFKESSAEGLNTLSEKETEYFWLQTRLLGWTAHKKLEINTVYPAYLEVLQKHERIMKLLKKTETKLLLHNLQAELSEAEFNEILEHLHRNK